MKIDVAFGVYAWVGLVRFKFDGAVDVVILEGFVEIPPIAEDTKCGVPAVKVPVLRIIRVGEQVHGGVADAFLSGALGACIGAYEISCLCEEVVIAGGACIDGFFGVIPKSPDPASVPGALSVEGPTPTPSVLPRGNVTFGRGSGWWRGSSSQ
jgi:hypothetical protein